MKQFSNIDFRNATIEVVGTKGNNNVLGTDSSGNLQWQSKSGLSKVSVTITGDGSTDTWFVYHNLGTKDLIVSVRNDDKGSSSVGNRFANDDLTVRDLGYAGTADEAVEVAYVDDQNGPSDYYVAVRPATVLGSGEKIFVTIIG